MRSILSTPERRLSSVDIAPTAMPDTLGTTTGSTAYGSDDKTAFNLLGMGGHEATEMQPPIRFMTFDQMRREDAAVKSSIWLVTQPIRSAQWTLVPASEDPADIVVADALRWQFGLEDQDSHLDLTWREQLSQKLLMIPYGCMFEEIMVGDVDIFYDADGDPHPIRPFARLAPRFPQSIRFPDGIKTDTRTGHIKTFTQWLPKANPIPGQKMAWYIMDKEGNDWLGNAMLRPMFGSWKLKRAVMVSAGIGWDRFAFGTPVIRYPKGGGLPRKQEAENIGRNWRTHERGYFVLEGRREEGWDVTVEGSGQMQDPTSLIHTYDEQIASAAMQHFIVLGKTSSGGGNRALGDALSEPYYMFLNSVADDIAAATRKHVFRKWIDMNFGPEYDVPKLSVSKLQARNVAVLAAAIAALSDAGLSFTDPETSNDIRDQLDLRQLPDDAQAAIAAVTTNDPGTGIAATTDGGPAADGTTSPSRRAPAVGATTSSGRPALSEGDGLGYDE